mgnify:CR=1 FL=1|jgi:radical SAM superfamily enzyme YgiQ (UPF0313 family)
MKVALINVGFGPEESDLRPSPPFGIMHLAAYLRREGYDITLLDWSGEPLDDMKHAALRAANADVIGIHVKISSVILRALEVSRWAREDGRTVIWGGPGPTTLPDETVLQAPVDAAVLGEGEVTFLELIRTMERNGDLASVKGIAFARDGRAIKTEPRGRISDLDSLPLPWWEGLGDLSRYHVPLHGRSVVPIVTSRGCPGKCGFCYARSMWGGRWQALSPARVLDAMEHVLSLDDRIGGFLIIDDLFYASPDRVRDICAGIKERGLDIVWNCEIRADVVRPELLDIMKDAGCRQVLIGVESGSPRMLEMVNKGTTVEAMKAAAAAVHNAGLELYAMMVGGLPTETDEDVKATERLLRTIRPEYTEFLSYTPYPGTPLYENAIAEGFVPPATLEEWGRVGTFDLSAIDRKGISDLPSGKYLDMERRTRRRAVVRSYMDAALKEPLTAPARGIRYLFKGSKGREE